MRVGHRITPPAEGRRSLAEVLESSIRRIWPRRAQQELLLDLGEHKRWKASDLQDAVDVAAEWMQRELLLPPTLDLKPPSGEPPLETRALLVARELGEALARRPSDVGVARWASGIAPALGTSAKTLANSVSQPLADHRNDHRWLRLIGRVLDGDGASDAWVFHRRSPGVVARELGALAARTHLDAGDALLVMSLLALWQRRRPTTEARGNRGRQRSRGQTPKPIASLNATLAQAGQVPALLEVSKQLPGPSGRALAELAIEAALTEAHLAPHTGRVAQDASASTRIAGEAWLNIVEEGLVAAGALLSELDRCVLAFRVERMRAWRARQPQIVPDSALVVHPYVAASTTLERRRNESGVEPMRFRSSAPGMFMLLPALRSQGLLEGS